MKKWLLHPARIAESSKLAGGLNISTLAAQILLNRGITDLQPAESFIRPRLSCLRDPFEIPNIEAAAKRVLLAGERGELVTVYGDYDVDGVTGTAILVQAFKFLGIKTAYYIPHRYGEGYSLSLESVNKIAGSGSKLIVTVDCGISSFAEVEEANRLGLDVIVTDHHNLPEKLPKALAIVNPKQLEGEHPSKHLSGAGVAFKFAWALLRLAGIKDSGFLTSLLDLAALGTISDVVPLTDENRILAVTGLNLIDQRKRLGVKHLAETASLSGKITVNNIYFGLAPRINAAGRLEHASKSVELLLSDNQLEAGELARELGRINSRRQELGSSIKEEVFSSIDENYLADNKLILLSGQDWHPGVIGIVASQVVDAYSRPTVLIGIKDGVGRGSARSVEGLNIFSLLNTCRDLFIDFGGHEGAAGFEIALLNIPELKSRLKDEVEKRIKPEDLIPKIEIDAELDPAQISLNMIKELELLAPHGEGNPAPVFMIKRVTLSDFRKVGKTSKHLKARFEGDGGVNLEAIGFGLGNLADGLAGQKEYDLAFNLECNEFNGFETAQLSLIDMRENNSPPIPLS
ncbi:MAG: single-stranded-DNA-specific exonuclease RecJ [Candidatus Margulisbacteria bacterium]|nr:single-stranded-DNA-specific exonuclease RecJ [Candidatus Margulisiibacteriota bacterium]